MTTVATERENKVSQRESIKKNLSQVELLGEVVTWNMYLPKRHSEVLTALRAAELDEGMAKSRAPSSAFQRACKYLSDERVIDIVRSDMDEAVFQFTRKHIQSADVGELEWSFEKETYVHLNKHTGKVTCKIPELEKRAQECLDRCLDEWTAGDCGAIVQKLFEQHAHLIPLRDRGGVYFIPQMYAEYVDKVGEFVKFLHGELGRFPVPSGTPQGDASVHVSVTGAMQKVVEEYEEAIQGFSINTRQSTLEDMTEKIKLARTRCEAYALYLQDRRDELLQSLDGCNEKLLHKIEELSGEKQQATQSGGGGRDVLGCRIGGAPARINAALTTEPQTLAELSEKAGAPEGRVKQHLDFWKGRGAPICSQNGQYFLTGSLDRSSWTN